jgi:hypothetical protein
MAILEPDRYAESTAVWTGGAKRGKAYDAFCEDNGGKDILSQSEAAAIMAMRSAVMQDGDAARVLRSCQVFEYVAQWDGGPCIGVCKGRLDGCAGQGATGMLMDYKTCREIGKGGERFMRSAEGMGYSHQLAWYWAAMGKPVNVWVVAQESAPPYSVAVFWVPAGVLEPALAECEEIARMYRVCEATGHFPGPTQGVVTWERPSWATGEQDMTNGTMDGGDL